MNPTELLAGLTKSRDSLEQQDVKVAEVVNKCYGQILKSFRLEAQYEKLRRNEKIPRIEDFESDGPPLSKDDLKTIKEASAMRREIGKRLKEIKKEKRNK